MSNIIQTDKISKLGFGFMRLPKKGDGFDMEQINRMTDAYLESGGNYFDTAFVYSGSEEAMRESLIKRHPREKYMVATKLNLRYADGPDKLEEQFKTSMQRLGTDYIDFYLLHNMNSKMSRKAEEWGAWDFLLDLKRKGLAKHVGFSFHGQVCDLDEILQNHPEVDFVQLQINYIDWVSPKHDSRGVYEVARAHGKPIVVMEPVKGGLLASENSPIAKFLRSENPSASLASWALRFCAELPGVFTTLSGMSEMAHVTDNIATFKDLQPLSAAERTAIDKAVEIFKSVPLVECTGCNYCENCPAKIMIPELLDIYNNYLVYNTKDKIEPIYRLFSSSWGAPVSACVSCGVCETACPQQLEITDSLKKLSALFD